MAALFIREAGGAGPVRAHGARDETDPSLLLRTGLDALLAELAHVVDEALQPEHVSIWLRKQKAPTLTSGPQAKCS